MNFSTKVDGWHRNEPAHHKRHKRVLRKLMNVLEPTNAKKTCLEHENRASPNRIFCDFRLFCEAYFRFQPRWMAGTKMSLHTINIINVFYAMY